MQKQSIFALLIASLIANHIGLTLYGQTIRVASYNLQDKPVNQQHDQDLRAILDAIGDYQANGVARQIDLMAFQEGPFSTGAYPFLESNFEIEYDGDFEVIYATADSNGDRTGFVYNADKLMLISSQSINNLGFTHQPMLATFRPIGGQTEDEFSAISIHLKAGTTSEDFDRREMEAMRLGEIVDSLPLGQPVLFLGDFNMKGSDEAAWPQLEAAGARDTINAPLGLRTAKWINSVAYHPFHTQDTTGLNGGMDDRFDLILISSEFLDGRGIEFNLGSLTAFGNNGTHILNSNIMTGSGGDPVQPSLMAISDHLPLFADFDWGRMRSTPDNFFSDLAVANYTVRPSGPRTDNGGTSLFQVEGTNNGNFASFGVIDFDLTGVLAENRVAVRIDEIALRLVQENESFTADGPVSVYVASPAGANVVINSSIRFQTGNNKLECVPTVLSADAELTATYPGVHHSTTGSNLPDGTLDEVVLYRDAIRRAMLDALNRDGKFRLLIVPDHPDTAATYAGNTNGTYSGPSISGLYDIRRPVPIGPKAGLTEYEIYDR